jgi:hypothetical protein
MFDPIKNRLTIGGANDITKQTAQRLNLLAQADIFFILRHGVCAPVKAAS